jgi:hypothetical protein
VTAINDDQVKTLTVKTSQTKMGRSCECSLSNQLIIGSILSLIILFAYHNLQIPSTNYVTTYKTRTNTSSRLRPFSAEAVASNTDKYSHELTTLVVLFGGLRGGEVAWNSLYTHVLDVNNAHLALVVSESAKSKSSSIYKRADYIWEIPEYSDWGRSAFDAVYGAGSGTFFSTLTTTPEIVKWSGPIQWYFKALVLRVIHQSGLTNVYDRFVITRPDMYYLCDLDLSDFHPDFIWIPEGEDWDGINDRQMVVSKSDLNSTLDMIGTISHNKNDFRNKKSYIHKHKSWFINAEQILKRYLEKNGVYDRVRRYSSVGFTIRAEGDNARWSKGKLTEVAKGVFVNVKYPSEYKGAKKSCEIFHHIEKINKFYLQKTASSTPSRNTAVYFKVSFSSGVSHAVLRCYLQKLHAFLASNHNAPTKTQMDVYIMFSPNENTNIHYKMKLLELAKTYKSTATFRVEDHRTTQNWPIVGTSRSGYGVAMKQFLRFGAINRARYTHVWYLEMDVIYSAPWSELFDAANHPKLADIDLLAQQIPINDKWKWKTKAPNRKGCFLLNYQCTTLAKIIQPKRQLTQTFSSIVRISTKYSRALSDLLEKRSINAHFEFFLGNTCKILNAIGSFACKEKLFSDIKIPTRFYTLGGHSIWGSRKKNNPAYSMTGLALGLSKLHNDNTFPHFDPFRTLTWANLPKSEIYHPVKCFSDLSSGSAALYYAKLFTRAASNIRSSSTLTVNDQTTVRYTFSSSMVKKLSILRQKKTRKLIGLIVKYDEFIQWSDETRKDQLNKFNNNGATDVIFVMWCYTLTRTFEEKVLDAEMNDDVLCADLFGVSEHGNALVLLEKKIVVHFATKIVHLSKSYVSSVKLYRKENRLLRSWNAKNRQ